MRKLLPIDGGRITDARYDMAIEVWRSGMGWQWVAQEVEGRTADWFYQA